MLDNYKYKILEMYKTFHIEWNILNVKKLSQVTCFHVLKYYLIKLTETRNAALFCTWYYKLLLTMAT